MADKARGSAMSSKQLARTVLHGRAVTFRFATGDPITGYLCGMDDFHYMIVTPEGQKHLIHKGSASIITLADTPSYESEPCHTALEKVVGPFRTYVEGAFFGRSSAVTPPGERAAV